MNVDYDPSLRWSGAFARALEVEARDVHERLRPTSKITGVRRYQQWGAWMSAYHANVRGLAGTTEDYVLGRIDLAEFERRVDILIR